MARSINIKCGGILYTPINKYSPSIISNIAKLSFNFSINRRFLFPFLSRRGEELAGSLKNAVGCYRKGESASFA